MGTLQTVCTLYRTLAHPSLFLAPGAIFQTRGWEAASWRTIRTRRGVGRASLAAARGSRTVSLAPQSYVRTELKVLEAWVFEARPLLSFLISELNKVRLMISNLLGCADDVRSVAALLELAATLERRKMEFRRYMTSIYATISTISHISHKNRDFIYLLFS